MKNDLLKWLLGIVQALILMGIATVGSVVLDNRSKLDTTSTNQNHITANQVRMSQEISAARAELATMRSEVAVFGERFASQDERIRRLEGK